MILGGVEIPYDKGLKGHSDADALCHAITDSILGACGLPDIGELFPDTDDSFKNIRSLDLLKQLVNKINNKNYKIIYIDAIIITQEPKLSEFKPAMKKNIAQVLGVSVDRINIKAKTNEGMGFIGRSEGLAVFATSTVERGFND
jgi:2-C-methyl-D-erythritol 2,4-cyclodiphosphate synthase